MTHSAKLTEDGYIDNRPVWLRWLPHRVIFLMKELATVVFLRNRIWLATHGEDFVAQLLQNKVDLDHDAKVAYTYSLLKSLKKLCDEHGIPVVLAAIPSVSLFWITRGSVGYLRHLRAFCEANGFTFVDVSEGFWAREDPKRFYICPWDNHLSPLGHRSVADQLYPVVLRLLRR